MRRRILIIAGAMAAIPVFVFGVLVLNALYYDADDPRDRANSYVSRVSATVDQPIEVVFDFVQRGIPAIYHQMSPMHDHFNIVNGDVLVVGAQVDCVEGDPDQIVRHRYVVTEVRPPNMLAMESVDSEVFDRASGDFVTSVDVWVYFDLVRLQSDATELTQTVVMDMGSPFYKATIDVLAFLSGNRGLWEQQFVEEVTTLARFAAVHQMGAVVTEGLPSLPQGL